MGFLTRCNYCSIQAMKVVAQKRGTVVLVREVDHGIMTGWYSVKYANQKLPCGYFRELTDRCVC